MRTRDPIVAFVIHCAIALAACGAGVVVGAWWDDGSFSLFRQSLPVIAIAAIAGRASGGWLKSRAAAWIWIPSALFLVLLLVAEAGGWTDRTRPPEGVAAYAWNQFVGPRCGPTECFDAIFGTAPFLGAVAYSLAARFKKTPER